MRIYFTAQIIYDLLSLVKIEITFNRHHFPVCSSSFSPKILDLPAVPADLSSMAHAVTAGMRVPPYSQSKHFSFIFKARVFSVLQYSGFQRVRIYKRKSTLNDACHWSHLPHKVTTINTNNKNYK